MIKLKDLIEASVDPKLVARSKQTGKLVYFKNAQNKDAAMKAGTHLDPNAEKNGKPKADVKPNDMFGGDYQKDRGGNPNEDSIIPSDKSFTELGKKAGYNFNLGNCDLFARAMHRVTGYPIVVIKGWTEEDDWDEDGETELVDEPYHVMVKLPNGKFRDADGEYTLEELTPYLGLDPDNGIKKVTAEPIEDENVIDVYGSDYSDDEIKKVTDLIIKNK
jgi:hypothetical protein